MSRWCRSILAVFALTLVAATPAAAQSGNGLVAAYGFEDTGNLTVVGDSTSFGHTGTVAGGAGRAAGKFGNALSFDGSNDLVRIADAGPLNLASGMTLEAWVRPNTISGYRTVLLKGRRSDLSYGLYGDPSANVSSGNETGTAVASASAETGAWNHLAATYDGTTLRVYLNGAQVGSATRPGPLTPGDQPLTIGGNDVWGEFYSGLIDEVRVYDRPLSAAEIQADMAAPVGAPAANPPGAQPNQVGAWTPPVQWPLVAVHTSMLSNGKVATWDAFTAAPDSERVWDPETGSFVRTPSGINLFCAGHALLPDGRLFVAGGHELAYVGLRDTRLFNPLAGNTWTAGPTMARGRWYPTTTTLSDGRVLIVSGDNVPTTRGPNTPFIYPSDTLPEIYDPKTNTIQTMPSASRRMPLYPLMFLTRDGRVVDAGPDKTTRILDVNSGTWSTLASQSPIEAGSAVMYRPGEVLASGTWTDTDYPNTVPISNKAAVLGMNQAVPAWRNVAPMKWARSNHTLTVLPDGDVLAMGGQAISNNGSLPYSPVLQPEIYHPATNTWTPLANSVRPRGYHNTSLLLPDGRILLAGSGRLDGSMMVNETSAEIYSPPYLFKGPRPTISQAPAAMEYSDEITVQTPDASRIAKVSLVRTGSVTHGFNMDQRWQQLDFRQVDGGLEIDAPTSNHDAPPGVYYLFLVDDNGVPSKAAILSIFPKDDSTPDTTAPSVPSNVQASGALGRVSLSWSASSDDVGVTRYAVHRSASAGFTPSAATQVATVSTGTSYNDTGLAAGTYYYRVIAEDAAGNASAPSVEASGTALADTTAPTVSVTAPASGATVRGTVSVTANASDDVGVAGVQFRLDGANLGDEDTSAPYSVSWDTTAASAGPHTLTAVARDATGNPRTSASVPVTVDNSAPPGPQPVAAYSFEDGSGTTLTDVTGNGHPGTIREATWTTTGKNGRALRFDGTNDWVTINDAADLHLSNAMTIEAWVNPTRNTAWRTVILKERPGDLDWALYSSGSARPSAWASTSGGMGSVTGPTAPANNVWTHMTATFDAATIRLYVNGVQVATAARSGALTSSTGALRLGGNSLWAEWFQGQMDDVRIYDTVLTATQIQADMNTPAGAPAAPADTAAPSVPQNVSASGSLDRVSLSWSASTDNVGVTRYVVHRSTTSGFTPSAATRLATPTGTSYSDTGLAPGTYYYRVVAEDAAGNASAPSAQATGTATGDISAPSVPSGVEATGAMGRVSLTWPASTDNVGVTRYVVHRSATAGFTPSVGTQVATVTGTSHNDTGLVPGTYFYRVVAEDAAGNASAPSAEASGTATGDTAAPSVPQNLSATGAFERVSLSWSASSDNVGVTRYVVHRSATAGFTPSAETRLTTVTGASYNDIDLEPGTYYYRVVAEDAAGNASAPSAEASGTAVGDTTAPVVSLTAPASGATVRATVSVTANASDAIGVAGVRFQLDGADLGGEDTSAPYSVNWDTTAASAGPHTLTAIARDAAGNATTSATVSVTVDNSVPTGPVPVAAYSFENGSGTTLTDVTGKGHTGTIREAAWTTTGKTGRALRFDGVNDWVTINDAPDLHLSSAMTLEVWVNPTRNTAWRTAILKERPGDLDWALYSSGVSRPSAWASTAGGMGSVTGPTAPALNVWTHMAATFDATTIRLYVNGVQVATAARGGALTSSTGLLRLGGNSLWAEWFQGQMDDVRIYDTVLTPAQIQADMNAPVS